MTVERSRIRTRTDVWHPDLDEEERNEYWKITALLPAYYRTAPDGRAFIDSHSPMLPVPTRNKMYYLPKPYTTFSSFS